MNITHDNIEALAVMVAKKVMEEVQVAETKPRWLTLEEAADYARASVKKMRTWIEQGYIYGFRRTGKYVIDRESIDKWYNSEKIDFRRN